MNTPSGLLVHRAVVHSVDAITGACKVRIPSLFGGQVVTVDPAAISPVIGTNVTVCSTLDLSEFFFVEGAGGGGALDPDLVAIGALPSAANTMPYATGPSAWALTTLTPFARTLVDDPDAATMRTTLGIPAGVANAYTHNQGATASVWTINHNLGFFPNATVIDSGGSNVEGDIVHVNNNTMTITFTGSFTGVAYLS